MPKKTVYFMTPSFTGHFNPMCGLVHEVAKNPDIDCVFYGIQEHKEKIEKTGARFRLFAHRNGADFVPGDLDDKDKNKRTFDYFVDIIECIRKHIPAVMKDIEAEKPSLIVYDPIFVIGRYMQEYLEKKGTNIKFFLFYPNFVITKEMMKELPNFFKVDLDLFVGICRVFLKFV
jgi:UDP:flavonoid glycosyltransferase YjiC (YdhE family)